MRPPRPLEVTFTATIAAPVLAPGEVEWGVLRQNPAPDFDTRSREIPHHMNAGLISWLPAPEREGPIALDLRCGA